MYKESYKRLRMTITEFDVEDVITTSGINADENEMIGGPATMPGGRSTTATPNSAPIGH